MDPKPNFIQLEHEVLKLWEDGRFFEKRAAKNQGKPVFRFLDGPITANNSMGVHHAWGRTIKDVTLRYKAMSGHDCLCRNGFDTQGLWVEVEVEKELGFQGKRDIEAYGMAEFTQKCVERIRRFSGVITEQSKRLGQWMDWDNSYYTHTDENIGGIWHFLQVCHNNGWIVHANRPMPWCPRCGTSLSEHEMTGSYKEMQHTAVFFKLPVIDRDFDILVWTTTPWTLSANVALAVHPELDYYLVRYEGADRPVLLAKSAIGHLPGKKEIVGSMKGAELEGLRFTGVFPELPVQKEIEEYHKIILWDEVSAEEGSGVVHIAPGCGAEDYELGKALGLPAVCPVDENGRFTAEYGFLAGMAADEVPETVFAALEAQGKLVKTHAYTHSYPVCWRCKTPVLFRLVREWYIRTEEIRPKLIEAANTVKWNPVYGGKRMTDWLSNMGDWNISRKRYYGLPLPFYPCECGHLTVVGSKEELRRLAVDPAAVDALPELHRPWIDAVQVRCPACGNAVSRITEVGDVWLDAGITPFTTQGYFSDRAYWEKCFPAEWITEMYEQIRLWFYSMLFMSVTLTGRAPYQQVQTYNMVVAEDGTKFSKTGFMIRFDEAAEQIGADAVRYLFAGANLASDVRFGFTLGEEARRKLLGFWNICTFFATYAELEQPDLTKPIDPVACTLSDRWMLARLDAALREITAYYESYDLAGVVKAFELLVDDTSNWYVRINRRRFWDGDAAACGCLFKVIRTMTAMIAPIVPFMTERIWQDLVRRYLPDAAESVHLSDFPAVENTGGEELLRYTAAAREIVSLALKLRNEQQIKVKQPLRTVYALIRDENWRRELAPYASIICEELNIKELRFITSLDALQDRFLTLNFRQAGAALKGDVNLVKGLLDALDTDAQAAAAAKLDESGEITLPGYDKALPAALFTVNTRPKAHIAITNDGESYVALDTALDEALLAEGTYRILLRQCQVLRREFGFRVEQHIKLALYTADEALTAVIAGYAAQLQSETLSDAFYTAPQGLAHQKTVFLDDAEVTVEMEVQGSC